MQLMSFETTTLTSSAKPPEASVADLLRDQILSGKYQPGDWLPTERRLAESLRVDRRIVRLAINRLVKSGLVTRQPHCRPVVAALAEQSPAEDAPMLPKAASSFIALLMWRGGRLERTLAAQQRIFWGMDQALAEAGYHAVFVDIGALGPEEQNAACEAERLRYVLRQGFGGAVFYPYAYRSNQAIIEAVRREIPLVTIDRRSAFVETDFIGIQNRRAVYDTVMHLAGLGHRRIAYVTKHEQVTAVQDRTQGYLDAVRDAGLDEIILPIPLRDQEQVWTVADTVFQLPKGVRPTAAAVFNDYSAVDLMMRLETLGLSVPSDVAITGFDSIVPALPNGVGLTSPAQPYEEIGRKAAELILRRCKDLTAPIQSVELPAPLMIRESSQYHGQDFPK